MKKVFPQISKLTAALIMAGSLQGCLDEPSTSSTYQIIDPPPVAGVDIQANYKPKNVRFSYQRDEDAQWDHMKDVYGQNVDDLNEEGQKADQAANSDTYPDFTDESKVPTYEARAYPEVGTVVKMQMEIPSTPAFSFLTETPPAEICPDGEFVPHEPILTGGEGQPVAACSPWLTLAAAPEEGVEVLEYDPSADYTAGDIVSFVINDADENPVTHYFKAKNDIRLDGGAGDGGTDGGTGDGGTDGGSGDGGTDGGTGEVVPPPVSEQIWGVFKTRWYASETDAPSFTPKNGPWELIAVTDETGKYLPFAKSIFPYDEQGTYEQGAIVRHAVEYPDGQVKETYFEAKWWVNPVSDTGTETPDLENPDTENPDTETPDLENPDTENPDTETPDLENPDTENPDTETPDLENPDTENPDTETPDLENPVFFDSEPAPEYVPGAPYKEGDLVTQDDVVYRCKIAGWCSQAVYQPGGGDAGAGHPDAWKEAWEVVGDTDTDTDTDTDEGVKLCSNGGNTNPVPILTVQSGVKGVTDPAWCSPWQVIELDAEEENEIVKPDLGADLVEPPVIAPEACVDGNCAVTLPEGTPTVPPVVATPLPVFPDGEKPTVLPMPTPDELGESGLPKEGYEFLREVTDANWHWMFPNRENAAAPTTNEGNQGSGVAKAGADKYTLASFKAAVVKYNTWADKNDYPQFLNEGSKLEQGTEFASFFAQVTQETNGLNLNHGKLPVDATVEAPVSLGGLMRLHQKGFGVNSFAIGSFDKDVPTVFKMTKPMSYHGRGYLHMKWNYNYGAFSQWLYQNGLFPDVITSEFKLIETPDLVATNPELAGLSAIWSWMRAEGAKPASHDVIMGEITHVSESTRDLGLPQTFDNFYPVAEGQTNDPGVLAYRLGSITNIINGGLECNKASSWNPASLRRLSYYNVYATYYNVELDMSISLITDHDAENNEVIVYWNDRITDESAANVKSAACWNQKSYYSW